MSRTQSRTISIWQLRFWNSRGFVIILSICFCFIALAVVNETVRFLTTRQQISALNRDINSLQTRNSQLRNLIVLLNSHSEQDKAARAKLGFQQPGEQVVMFPDTNEQKTTMITTTGAEHVKIEDTSKESNPSKWLNYFLNP